jgi:hypothetical protein
MLLNGKVTLDIARAFAGRVRADVGDEPAKVIDRAHRLAVGRAPDADERATLLAFLQRETALLKGRNSPPDAAFSAAVADLCHALLNVNEFLYID